MASLAGAGLAAALALAVAAPAGAELYRCEREDGSVTYTDNAGACRGARPHQPKGDFQRMESHAPAPRAEAPPHPAQDALLERARAGEESRWRQLKRQKESELARVAAQRKSLEEFVGHCNRGSEVIRRTASGLKERVSCASIRSEHAELEARESELRAYVEVGIHEECRRAGCLPGWLR